MHDVHITQEEADEFALGVTDKEASREIALHAATCEECQSRIDAAEDLTARLALSAPVERPSHRMRSRVFEATGIAQQRPLARFLRLSSAVATVAALSLGAFAFIAIFGLRGEIESLRSENLALDRQVDEALSQRVELAVLSQELDTTTQRVDDLLERAQDDRELQLALLSPNSRQARVVSPDLGENGPIGRFVWDPEQARFWFVAEGLAPQPTGKTYELFAGANGNYISLGTFNAEPDGFVLFKANVPAGLEQYDSAAITIEDHGNHERTGPAVFVLDLKQALQK